MDADKMQRVKNAVKANFEDSPGPYADFESRYGFFETLTSSLLEPMRLAPGARILEVGCGTGAGTRAIVRSVPESRVWGLDFSPAMLEYARETMGSSERVRFVEGDAAHLTTLFDTGFDAVIYTASIFLVPDFRESLRQAGELLNPGGTVGLSFMDGVLDANGENAFAAVDQKEALGLSVKRPVYLKDCREALEVDFADVSVWHEVFSTGREMLKAFYSVPAMSAGLFPGLPYEERRNRVSRLVDGLQEPQIGFRWVFATGINRR